MSTSSFERPPMPRWRQYWVLTKPRVTQLAVFCAIIGMFLATPGMVPWSILIGGSIGIWLLAGAAFAVNCLIEQAVDAKMRRTACLLYTSPSPRDRQKSRMPSSA